MDDSDFKKRIIDLRERSVRRQIITSSAFLTPHEQSEILSLSPVLCGGFQDSERKIAVFLPDWCTKEAFSQEDLLSALKIQSFFGTPSHRDYLGAVLGLGIERDRIGDIFVTADTAYLVCLYSVSQYIANELSQAGRISVKAYPISLDELPVQTKDIRQISFTVKSLRIDAVCGEMFGISRTAATEAIKEGLVSLNYSECLKPDAPVDAGDVLSFRRKGKGRLTEIGGKSRKDRIFVKAELYK